MDWTKQAEEKLNEFLLQVPESIRDQTRDGARREAESYANEKQIKIIDLDQVVAGFIFATSASQREELKEKLKRCGVDWYKYRELFAY